MEFRIDFGGDPQDVTVTTSGVAELAGFERYNEALVTDPRFRRGMAMLFDHTDLDASRLTPSDLEAIGNLVVRLGPRFGRCSSAIVSGDRVTFGLSEISFSYADPTELTLRTFYTRAEALDWLRAEKAARATEAM